MSSSQQANLEAALRLAKAGFRVFPARFNELNSGTYRKTPCVTGWQEKATSDEATIRSWWKECPHAVPAVVTGSDLVVIDVDRHGDSDGIANFEKLIEGRDMPNVPVVNTAGGGKHYFFRQPKGEPLGNGRGDLPHGIDVRGRGGFVIASGAIRPDGKVYTPATNTPDLAEAFEKNAIPQLPDFLAEIIRGKHAPSPTTTDTTPPANGVSRSAPSLRERGYATCALNAEAQEVANAPIGTRNHTLNAVAYRMGTLIAAGWIDTDAVSKRLLKAAKKSGLTAEDGEDAVFKTLASGLRAGLKNPHPPLTPPKLRQIVGGPSDSIIVRWPGSKTDWPAPKWLVKDLIPENSAGLIVGESQAGKSFLAVHLAGSLAVGKPFLGKQIMEPGGTVYVGAEASLTIGERLHAEFGGSILPYRVSCGDEESEISLSNLPIPVLDNVPNLASAEGVESLIGAILALGDEMREKHGVPLRLVIVDTMVAGFALDDWNNAAQAAAALKVLHRIKYETGAVAIGVHHHGKDKSRGATGSYVFMASSDFILSVYRDADQDGNTGRRWAALTKSRWQETGWTCDFQLKSVVVGGDEYGDPSYCPFVEPYPDSIVKGDRDKTSKLSRSEVILKEVLDEVFASCDETVEFDDGHHRVVSKNLLRLKFDDRYGRTDEANRKAFDRAIKALAESSTILLKRKDGEDWLCEPRPATPEANGKNAALFGDPDNSE